MKLAAVAILWAVCLPAHSLAQQAGQKTFSSPEEAGDALEAAAQHNDENAMLQILGPAGKRIVSSGDGSEDIESRANFAKKYQQMHRLVKEPDGSVVLYIGAENWPTPIPLRYGAHAWYFDTPAGEDEIIFRRIGRNEMSAIRICTELVAAEQEYFAVHHTYAQKMFSDTPHEGLYWKASGTDVQSTGAQSTDAQSPIGPLVAAAFTHDNVESHDAHPTPYRGYLFHILTAQGKDAPGGAKSYVADGKMTNGFAFVAYPAEYLSSGVMTFIVSDNGVVYEKDLGKKTAEIADAMKTWNPGPGWKKTETPPETATNQ